MTRSSELSDRYRRLLRWYPADHRADHEEEMLGVLLAAARPGQVRPALRDSADLILGGLRVRAAHTVAAADGTGWRDALAVTGVLLPLVMSLGAVRLALLWRFPGYGVSVSPPNMAWDVRFAQTHPDWSDWAAWPLVAVVALLGARRLAGVGAVAALIWWAVIAAQQYVRYDKAGAIVSVWWPLLAVLAIAGLFAGPGPRRGLTVLGRSKTLLMAVGMLLATATVTILPVGAVGAERVFVIRTWAVPAAALAAMLAACSPVGRRLLALLSAPATAIVIMQETSAPGLYPSYSPVDPVTTLFLMLPICVTVFVTAALALDPAERMLRNPRRENRPGRPPVDRPTPWGG